ncbi:hypothetical protein CWI84_03585 [Idiomarina tyrosinivorans]|uniref:Uncharacterized protein n=2 Tax=Idiomarina tyrosinivorans TaxID=1445662 RepID=A0A432ZSL3_9GAMM|nr:hypothetical protein CWI84_03585 [Idiomarina tyrosinivorans]
MNEKWRLSYWQQRYGRLPVMLISVACLAILLWASYRLGMWYGGVLQDKVAQQGQQLSQLYQRIERLEYQRHVNEVELDIEKAANSSLQQELTIAQDENFGLRRELAFYQKIMAPELEADGVVIDSFVLTPNIAERHFHFKLAVIQLERRRKLIEGRISIHLVGRSNGAVKSYDLLDLARISDADRKFAMRYFSLYEGDFFLPEDFVPERFDVKVSLPESAQRQLERRFYWRSVLQSVEPREGVTTHSNT